MNSAQKPAAYRAPQASVNTTQKPAAYRPPQVKQAAAVQAEVLDYFIINMIII